MIKQSWRDKEHRKEKEREMKYELKKRIGENNEGA